MKKSQSGNVLIYILVAVVLIAALSMSLMKQNSGGSDGRLSDDRASLRAGELIDYATAARSTVEQMRVMMNVQPTEFNFSKQGTTGYTTGPHNPKVFHPVGGGLDVFADGPELYEGAAKRGWVAQQGTNVEWTPSSGSDILFTFVDVSQAICAKINDRLYRNSSIPDLSLTSSVAFINGDGDDADLTAASCPSCNGRPSMCVKDSEGNYAFYNVILSR